MWQDYVLMFGGFAFSGALIPAIRAKEKPPVKTSLWTAIILFMFVVCYATLGLWWAVSSNTLTVICWVVLLIQKLRRK